MAGAAGRRNILREISGLSDQGIGNTSFYNNLTTSSTPTSPDETVIQQRGHQRKSATYNYDASDPVFFKTPVKSPKKVNILNRLLSPAKTTPVRSSPRKRLNVTPDKLKSNEAVFAELTISSKRVKKGHLQNFQPNTPLEKGLKALSHSQLIELISNVLKNSPEIEKAFDEMLPVPDLLPIEQRLYTLQRNVFKSFPRNIWGSQDGSFCYLRVRTHLEAFKKECLDLCNQFMDSCHWPTVFEYIFIALKFTSGLPDWTNTSHNKIKNFCMKQLAAQCINALKEANLDKNALSEVIDRLQEFAEDTAVKTCIKFAADLMQTSSV